MKIQLDFNREEWYEFSKESPDESYKIIEEYWEDADEWAIIEIIDKKWQTWIYMRHPDWVVE